MKQIKSPVPALTPLPGCAAGGVCVGGGDILAKSGRTGRGCWTARGGLVVGGSPPPEVGCVGAGGQKVVPAEEEEIMAF